MNNLTPKLTLDQLKENIDALQKKGVDHGSVQAYVNNYQKTSEGTYALKTSTTAAPDNSFSGRVNQAVAKRGNEVLDSVKNADKQSDLSTGVQIGGSTLGLANDVVGEAVNSSPSAKLAAPGTKLALKSIIPGSAVVDSELNLPFVKSAFENIKNSLGTSFNNWSATHPEASKDIQALIEATKFAGNAVVAKAGIDSIPNQPLKSIANTAQNLANSSVEKTTAEELAKIQETITPKATVKEARMAQSQGRLIKGKEPTLFRSGTADEVIPTEKTVRATQTIQRQIPGAAQMDEAQLYTALDEKTSQIATELKPEMQKVQVKPETVSNVDSAWKKLKTSQLEVADATDEANVRKIQSSFEDRITKLKKKGVNLDDWWQARKDYDASVPENVKGANSMSSEVLQSRKTIWLQNRGILNDAINSSESGLGETSRQSFSDMHDMYNAKEGIQTKAKIETKIKPSKLNQAANSKTGKAIQGVVKGGLGAGAIYEAGKKLITGGF